jgi:O-antigen/teichoic acid export membrane protein
MRLFLGASQAASVLGNVAIPKLSSMRAQGLDTSKEARRAQLAFVLVGAAGGAAMAALPTSLIKNVLGDEYADLAKLLPWFGVLFMVRLSVSASGVLLTVNGQQSVRAGLTACHWGVVALVAWAVLPDFGVHGWLGALLFGSVVLSSAYAYVLHRTSSARTPALPVVASIATCAVLVVVALTRH